MPDHTIRLALLLGVMGLSFTMPRMRLIVCNQVIASVTPPPCLSAAASSTCILYMQEAMDYIGSRFRP